jgi:hypothetical protein
MRGSALLALLLMCGVAHAQSTASQGVLGYINVNGQFVPYDTTGAGIPVVPAGGVASVQGVAGGTPVPVSGAFFQATQPVSGAVSTTPGTRTLVPLDVAAVTTGGTAVTAIAAGHRTAGGVLQNPPGATINLCINEVSGTASGTTSAGSTICILPGQSYALAPSPNAVSVITSDSAHPFAGYGLQ